ncbi:hypothetical protein PI124_g17244 [Phytophthora idaei]|nr:hypothetical protein PI125_g22550 [Phytophthora idaei]KAG3133242.1 hypothetical protein PI126_g19262 [Phytophthora idaei]KAG3237780.1 hypothetical protein PI124_g17244 [Phytophthora idaei]
MIIERADTSNGEDGTEVAAAAFESDVDQDSQSTTTTTASYKCYNSFFSGFDYTSPATLRLRRLRRQSPSPLSLFVPTATRGTTTWFSSFVYNCYRAKKTRDVVEKPKVLGVSAAFESGKRNG